MTAMIKEILQYSSQKLLRKVDSKRNPAAPSMSSPYVNTIPGIPSHMNCPPATQKPYPATHQSSYNTHPDPQGAPPQHFDAQAIANSRHDATTSPTGTGLRGLLPSVQSRLAASLMPPNLQTLPTHQGQPQPTLRASITQEFVTDLSNNQPLLVISQANKHSKLLLNLTRWGGPLLGTVKFSDWSLGVVFTLHGHESKIKNEGQFTDKWCYRTTVFGGEKWCWKMKDSMHGELKTEGGEVMAKLAKGVLTIERVDLSHAAIDEIKVTAFAVWEKNRRDKKEGESLAEVLLKSC